MGVSDVIALIALIIGLQAALMAFYLKAIDKVLKKQNRGVQQILNNRELVDANHCVVLGALSELSSIQRLYGSLLVRISNHVNMKNSGLISTEIGEYDYLLEKSIHEANLFSSDVVKRQSSVRALAEEYGDLSSLDLMTRCNKYLLRGKDPDFISAINLLTKNIERKISSLQ